MLFLASPVSIIGQIDSSAVHDSPYGVIYNHLYYLQDDSYQPEKAALSFPENTVKVSDKAIKLKKILDGKGIYVDINRLPKNNNFTDTVSKENIYFIDRHDERIYVEKIGEAWHYSRTTVEMIPDMYREVFPFGSTFLDELHGPFWDTKLLSVSMSKWLGLLILLVFTSILFSLVNRLTRWLVSRIIRRRVALPDEVYKDLKKGSRVFALFLSTQFILYLLPMFQLPIRFNAFLIKGLDILSIFFLIFLVIRIVSIVFHYLNKATQQTDNTLDDQLMPVLNRIAQIIIWAIGIIYILDSLDVNVTALLAGISIGGLAIALAAQDTVKNFFGSIMIFLDRPFQIGDAISFNGIDGSVEEVGVRSTRIRTFANSVVYVPNGKLADSIVDNMGLRQFRRFKTDIGITYDTSPKKIDLFIKGIRHILANHPHTRKDNFEVHLNSFGASSINILVYCFIDTAEWAVELKSRHDILYAIIFLAEELGVSFAFPSQSLYIESLPKGDSGSETNSPEERYAQGIQRIERFFETGDL